jgi:hypothetical protein
MRGLAQEEGRKDFAKNGLKAKLLNANRIKDLNNDERSKLIEKHKTISETLQFFYFGKDNNEKNDGKEHGLKRIQSKAIELANTKPNKGIEIVSSIILSGVNGVFVAFLGISTVHFAAHVAVATIFVIAANPIIFGIAVGAAIIGFLAGVVVAHLVKQYGKSIAKKLSGKQTMEEIKKLEMDEEILNAKAAVELEEKQTKNDKEVTLKRSESKDCENNILKQEKNDKNPEKNKKENSEIEKLQKQVEE